MGNSEVSTKRNRECSTSCTPRNYKQIVSQNSAMDLDNKIPSSLLPDDISEEEKMEMNKKKLKLQAQFSQLEYKIKYFTQKTTENEDESLNVNKTKSRYEGTFKDGLVFGQGIYFYSTGSIFMGEIKNNGREGLGVFYFSNGNVYSGQWSKNDQNGIGKFYFIQHGKLFQFYSGYFKNSLYEGFGCYCYQNKYYLGFWKDDQYNGHGKILSFEGELLKCGIFKQDKLVEELQEHQIVFPGNWSIFLPNFSAENIRYANLIENKPAF